MTHPNKKKVNIITQILLVIVGLIIPLVWIYPFYKIKKITRLISIKLLIIGVSFIPIIVIMFIDIDETVSEYLFMFFIFIYMGIGLIDLPFIIKWSKAWNKKLESTVL